MAEPQPPAGPHEVELNDRHAGGREGAARRFPELYREVTGGRGGGDPVRVWPDLPVKAMWR